MKHKIRAKALSWLLSVALVLSLLPGMSLTVYAETSTWTSGDCTVTYDTDTNTVTVKKTNASSATGNMADYGVDSDDSVPVSPWSDIKGSFQNIVIEEGVTGIGKNAFINCESIKNITIPASVTNIGEMAFYTSGLDRRVIFIRPESESSLTVANNAFYYETTLAYSDGGNYSLYAGDSEIELSGSWNGNKLNGKTLTWKLPIFSITNNSVNGSVTASVGGNNVTKAEVGNTVTLTVTPASGYQFESIKATTPKEGVEDFNDLVSLMGTAVFAGDDYSSPSFSGYTCKVEGDKFVVYNGTTLVAETANISGFNVGSYGVSFSCGAINWSFNISDGKITGINLSDTANSWNTLFDSASPSESNGSLQPSNLELTTVTAGLKYSFTMPKKSVTVTAEFEESTHEHNFTYSASGATITATCGNTTDCPLAEHKATLTIVAPTLTTYGGTGNAAATLTGLDDFKTATGKTIATTDIKYVGRDGTTYEEIATAPTNAGKYTAKITLEEQTAQVNYEIAKVNQSVTAPTAMTGLVYDGKPQKLINEPTITNGNYEGKGISYQLNSGDWTTYIPYATNAGTYTVNYKVLGNENYNEYTGKPVTVTIAKANQTVDAPTGKDNLVYTGNSQQLIDKLPMVTKGNISGPIEYRVNDDGTWSSMLPSAVNAGEHTVYYRVPQNDNYNKYEGSIQVPIAKADPQAPSGLTATYGQTLADVALPAGWTWSDSSTGVGVAGTHSFKANCSPTDTANYNPISDVDVNVTVSPADPIANAPTGLTATYGQTLADITLTNPGGNTPGTWAFVDEGTTSVGNAGEHTFKASFTPTDAVNYSTLSDVDVTVTVNKADQTAPAAPTMASASTNSVTLNTITNGEYSKDGTTWQTSPTFTGLTMNTEYTFYQRLAADANHNASPASASTSISTSNHTHSWSYAASGATITATCANSDGGHGTPLTSTLTINAPTLTTYGGTGSAEATITGSIDGVSNPTIVYKKGNETLVSAPTDVGTYTASITLDGKTANVEYTIGKASASATAPTANTLTYNGADQSLVNAGTASGGTIQYAIGTASAATGSYGAAIPAGKNAGTYYVWYKAVGDANHSDSEAACVTVTIAKKAVTATVTVADKAFDDTTTATVSASVTSGVIDGDDITITGLAGTFASKNIGTGITVAIDSSKATIAGADNYNVTIPTSATGNITAKSINDSNVTIYAIPNQNATGSEITPDPVIKYLGILLKKDTDYTLAYSNNTAEGTATVTVTGTSNYSGTRTANFTIIRAAYSGTLTVTDLGPYTYGDALGVAPTVSTTNGSGLSGEKVTVYYATTPSGTGTAWSSSAKLNAGTYYVWAELAATDTHDKATSERVTFTVNKATPAAPSGVLRATTYTDTYKVTLTIPSGKTYADYEYVVSTSESTPAANAWKSLPALTSGGFTPTEVTTQNTTYYVFLRTKADSNNNASAAATATLKTPAKVLLSYDANGSTASVPASVEYDSGTTATAAAAISRAGYTFTGWKTGRDSGTDYAADAAFSITANTTLYAQWTPISYSVTYHGNGTADPSAVSSVAYNATVTLPTPTRDGYTFNGWATTSGGNPIYRGGQKVSGLTTTNDATVELYAVWTENTYQVTGEVKEELDGTTEQSIVAGVTVKIMRGNVQFGATQTTNENGKYTFSGVPAGTYNIVATRQVESKTQTMTALVEVNSDKSVDPIVLPPSKINSVLTVAGDSTPPVMVGGLEEVAKDEAESTKEVTVTMTVEKKDESNASTEIKQQIKEIKEAVVADSATSGGNTELEVLDVKVEKKVGDEAATPVSETSQVVEIIVSFNMNGRFGFSLYRHHDGKAEPFQSRSGRFAKGSFADGYFFADKTAGLFYIYTSRFSTYAIGYEEGTSYAVTVNSGTGGGDYAECATVTITANAAPSGKVFDKWTTSDGVTFANASGATTTFTMPAKAVTVTATYRNTSSSGTPSSGGNGGNTNTITVPVSGDSASVSVSASVSGSTATVKAPTTAQLDKVIGESVKTGDVTIDVSGLNKDIATVSIPTETVKAIEKAVSDPDNDASALTVKLTDGTVTFDAAALAAITDQAKGSTIQLNLDNIGESKLKSAQKTAIRDLDVQAVYDAYMTSNGQRISDFKGGKATVTVSYTLKDGQTGRGVVVWYVAEDGKTTEVPTAYNDKTVSFTVEHFSNYVIAYDAQRAAVCPQDDTCPISAFSDASATAWYHDGVHYVLENGVMSGYGNGLFGPDDTTSRAMMAQILWNMEGKPVVNYAMRYTDVDADAWYAEAVRWATAQGIMNGYGGAEGGKFGPNDDMTREQLVTIMYRYAQMKKVDVSIGEDTNILSYDDALQVSEWAIPAMQWAVGADIVNGTSASTLSPKNNASRAEIATIVMRYCKQNAK